MEKSPKNNAIGNVSVSNIYETLKSRKFLEELWSDMLSDIKEKPTYNRIKDMVVQLVTQKSSYLSSSCHDSERLIRKTLLAEVSILAYTIDTVISKVLFNKMQNDFVSYVTEMIDDLNTESRTTKDGVCAQNKNFSLAGASEKKLSSAQEDKTKSIFNDSGSDSNQSDCSISICSVSSVHTSDLTSYDDVISISSEDEENGNKRKKRLSVKEASKLFFQGRVEEIHKIGRPAKQQKKEKIKTKPKTAASSSPLIESPSRKTLPARIRKPNSKYSSEDIICSMKGQLSNLDQISASESLSPPKTSPKEMKASPASSEPARKRGRPRKNVRELYTNSSLHSNAAAEDLNAIQNSKATMMLQANADQRKNSSQMDKSLTTYSSKGKTAYTMFSTK